MPIINIPTITATGVWTVDPTITVTSDKFVFTPNLPAHTAILTSSVPMALWVELFELFEKKLTQKDLDDFWARWNASMSGVACPVLPGARGPVVDLKSAKKEPRKRKKKVVEKAAAKRRNAPWNF